MIQRKALGRGLAALIPELPTAQGEKKTLNENASSQDGPSKKEDVHAAGGYVFCAMDAIAPSPENPRHFYDEQKLSELSQSIQQQGLIQPLVVRRRKPEEDLPASVDFVLIAGERRFRAAARAGLKTIPIVVKDVSPQESFELALVENVQRQDLNPIEEAEAYRRLSDEFGYTQEQLATRVGRARETIANALRLLKLPKTVQAMVATQALSMGHARTLLSVEKEEVIEQLAQHVAKRQLSVRQVEELVRKMRLQPSQAVKLPGTLKSAAMRSVEEGLEKIFKTRVRLIHKNAQRGKIEIEYHSSEQLDDLLNQLMKQ